MAENNSSATLLPCPFCGAAARGYEIEPHQHSAALLALVPDMPKEHQGSYVIEGDCRCGSGLIGDNQAEVTARWNARAPQAVAAQAPAAVAVPAVVDSFSACAIADSNYAAGMLLGWNLCVADDSETFSRIRSDRMSAAIQASRAARATPALPATEDSSAGDLAEVQAEPVALYVEARECYSCGHVGINDAADGKAACNTCDWQGDSPREDKCPDCNEVGTMTSACSECGARTSLIAEARLPVTAPEAQPADALDAERWRDHIGKLDALVTYCPTCCQGFAAKPEMTRDEVIFECGKTVGRSAAMATAQEGGNASAGKDGAA